MVAGHHFSRREFLKTSALTGTAVAVSSCNPLYTPTPMIPTELPPTTIDTPIPTNIPTTTPTATETPRPTATATATKTATKTATPELLPALMTDISRWKGYPKIKMADIESGAVARAVRQSDLLKSFDKAKLIPPKYTVFNKDASSTEFGYLYSSKESQAARVNPEARNLRVVCGWTVVFPDGYKMLGWTVQVASDIVPNGYVIATILQGHPDVTPTKFKRKRETWLTQRTQAIKAEGGGYATPVFKITTDPIWWNNSNSMSYIFYGDYLRKSNYLKYKSAYDAAMKMWFDGHPSSALETQVMVGHIDTY
jgi:hypothetical protein